MTVAAGIQSRGPGSLCHRVEDDGLGPSGCVKCGWRGIPNRTRDGGLDHRCPSCEISREVEDELRGAVRPKVGRNDPCSCGSGAKFKKCCGR